MPRAAAPRGVPALPQKPTAYALSATDPTMIFTILCAVIPALKDRDPGVMVQFAAEPYVWAAVAMVAVPLLWARKGGAALLYPWEQRAATWYLLNAAVFHFLLDFAVGTLKVLPVMQKNYQAMDTRYGCVPSNPCGMEAGVSRDPDPFVWTLTWIEALIDAPLCVLCFLAYTRGWAARKPLELLTCCSHFVGTIIFMAPEFYRGLQHVPPPPNNVGGPGGMLENLVGPMDPRFEAQFTFFWFAFICANAVWYVVPARLAWIAAADLSEAVAR